MVAMSFLQFPASKCAQLTRVKLSSHFAFGIVIAGVTMIWPTTRSDTHLRHRDIFETLSNIYFVNATLTMMFKTYVQWLLFADHLICIVPGICGASEGCPIFLGLAF